MMLLFHQQECSIDQTCTHVDDGEKCSILLGNLVSLAKRIPSDSPSTTKMEYRQTKFPIYGCSIAKGRHWEKQMANDMNY